MNEFYRTAYTVQEVKDYIGGHEAVAFDFETAPDEQYRAQPLAALDPHRAHIVGCSFSVEEGTGIYVPVAHRSGRNMCSAQFREMLKELLEDTATVKIAHNLAFEAAFSYALGIIIQPPVYDTLAASQLMLKGPFNFRTLAESGLKTLARELCGEPLPTFESVTAGRLFDELDPADYETVRYGAADSDYALRLRGIFNGWFDEYLPKHRYIAEQVESPASVYIGLMKYNGIPVDSRLLDEKDRLAEAKLSEIRREIGFMIGDVKIGSSCSTREFKAYLYEALGLPVLKRTESGDGSVDDSAMILLGEWCGENRPELAGLFDLVREYRTWGKLKSTYLDGYRKHINPATGRLHPDILSLSTETGRMCCRNPNAQNMPRKTNDPAGIRSLIRAPEGKVIVSCDFSQIELRIGAFYCRDEKMLSVYRAGGDIHAATTSVIYGISYEQALDKHAENYKERRTIAKNVNFGTFYGLFPRGLQSTLKFKAGVEKTMEECAQILQNLKSGYPGLSLWQDETKSIAAFRGWTETWLGRRRYLPGITGSDWGRKSFAERCALNTPIQGTAADIIKLACGRLLEAIRENPWLQPILQIHDELTFLVPGERLDEAVMIIKKCMEAKPFPELDLPLIAEASAGRSFGEMEELSFEQ